MTNIFLNSGITVDDLFKDLNRIQRQEIEKASEDGFSINELRSLETDGIDVSLIKDNSTDTAPIEEREDDTPELKEAKEKLKEINQNILDKTTEIRLLEAENIELEDEINEEYARIVDKQDELEENQKDDIKEAENKALKKYISKEGEMSEEEYQELLEDSFSEIDTKYGREFSNVAKRILDNETKIDILHTNLAKSKDLNSEVNNLKIEADDLTTQIQDMTNELKAQKQRKKAADTDAENETAAPASGNNSESGSDMNLKKANAILEEQNLPEGMRTYNDDPESVAQAQEYVDEINQKVEDASNKSDIEGVQQEKFIRKKEGV